MLSREAGCKGKQDRKEPRTGPSRTGPSEGGETLLQDEKSRESCGGNQGGKTLQESGCHHQCCKKGTAKRTDVSLCKGTLEQESARSDQNKECKGHGEAAGSFQV